MLPEPTRTLNTNPSFFARQSEQGAKAFCWNCLTISNHLSACGHVREIESAVCSAFYCSSAVSPLSAYGTASADVR
jgi:hypothetical protein